MSGRREVMHINRRQYIRVARSDGVKVVVLASDRGLPEVSRPQLVFNSDLVAAMLHFRLPMALPIDRTFDTFIVPLSPLLHCIIFHHVVLQLQAT